MVRCVIFDADHTLYTPRAERAYDELFDFLVAETGADRDDLEAAWADAVEAAKSSDAPDDRARDAVVRRVLAAVDVDPADAPVEAAVDRFWDAVVDDLAYRDAVRGVVDRLRAAGIAVVAVATDEFPDPVRRKLAVLFDDPEAVFDDIVTPRDTGTMKPAKAFYREVLDAHGVAPGEAVVVGDSWERDLAPAADLGMVTVLLRRDGSEPVGAPDHVVDAVEGVVPLVEGMQDGR